MQDEDQGSFLDRHTKVWILQSWPALKSRGSKIFNYSVDGYIIQKFSNESMPNSSTDMMIFTGDMSSIVNARKRTQL